MKKLLSALLVIGSLSSVSAMACDGEAQVIAQVDQTSFRLGIGCKLTLTKVTHFAANPYCPLDIDEINSLGITGDIASGHECALSSGDSISGVVVKRNGNLFLE